MSEQPTGHDPVNHPSHYTSHPSGVETIEMTRHLPFDLGNALKYVMRRGLKGSAQQDIEKAIWYLDDASKFSILYDLDARVVEAAEATIQAEENPYVVRVIEALCLPRPYVTKGPVDFRTAEGALREMLEAGRL